MSEETENETWSEWLDAQPDLYEGYDEWLAKQGLERNNENALLYIHVISRGLEYGWTDGWTCG